MQWLIQDSTRAERFCSKKYSANLAATGIVQADSVFSSTLACPVGVNSLGFQPSLHSLSAICCLDDGLNSITLSFKRLPVFSEYRCSIIGGNSSSHCLSILYSLRSYYIIFDHIILYSILLFSVLYSVFSILYAAM